MISENVLGSSSHLWTPDLLLRDTLQKALTLHASGQWVISTEPLISAYYSGTPSSVKKPNKFPEGDTLVNKDTWQRTDPTVNTLTAGIQIAGAWSTRRNFSGTPSTRKVVFG